MAENLREFLEEDGADVMIGYKEPVDDIEVLLEEFSGGRYIVADTFRNYTLENLKDIAASTVGEEQLYGVRNRLPGDRGVGNYRTAENPGDLDDRIEAVSGLVVQEVMKKDPEPEMVYVLDDIDNALGFSDEEEVFRYAHRLTGNFMSMDGKSVLLANRGYSGILRNLADTELDVSWQT